MLILDRGIFQELVNREPFGVYDEVTNIRTQRQRVSKKLNHAGDKVFEAHSALIRIRYVPSL